MGKKDKLIEYKRINNKRKYSEINNYNNYLQNENIDYQDKVKKIIKQGKKKVSRKVYILRQITILLILFIIIFLLISYLLFKSKYFMLLKVNMKGNNISKYEDIMENGNVKIYDNIFKNINEIVKNKKNIQIKSPYVKDIDIKLSGKHTLLLEIKEREKYYFVYDEEYHRYYILDKEGCILEQKENINQKEDELYVSGITFDKNIILSDYINDNDRGKLKIYENIKEEFYNKFKDIKITKLLLKKGKYYIYLNDKIEVILNGDYNLPYNLNLLKTILENINDIPGTIDMTKKNPTFVRFE